MAIENINNLTSALSNTLNKTQTQARGIEDSGDGFGNAVKNAIESIDETQKSANEQIAKTVSGESPDIHKTIIALQTADLKFQLGLQVRNKLIGAYEEVMRMQV